jgi:hypothetical protein
LCLVIPACSWRESSAFALLVFLSSKRFAHLSGERPAFGVTKGILPAASLTMTSESSCFVRKKDKAKALDPRVRGDDERQETLDRVRERVSESAHRCLSASRTSR